MLENLIYGKVSISQNSSSIHDSSGDIIKDRPAQSFKELEIIVRLRCVNFDDPDIKALIAAANKVAEIVKS